MTCGARDENEADEGDDDRWRNKGDHEQNWCRYFLMLNIGKAYTLIDEREGPVVWFDLGDTSGNGRDDAVRALATEQGIAIDFGATHMMTAQSKT